MAATVKEAAMSSPARELASQSRTSQSRTSQSRTSQENPRRTNDPERVRQNILEVAREEFVENGLSGARVNEIAERTATSKRMIYYYFTDKQGLYLAVLEDAYARIRALEKTLDLEHLPPTDALAILAGFTFDYHADNPDFVRLVMVENIHHAKHLKLLARIGEVNLSAIDMIRELYERGVGAGAFRTGVDPIDIHLMISALSFYNVSNRASIEQVFGHDMGGAEARVKRRASVIEAALRFVTR
ncbi:MAG: TetR/AcrR family transcriptional regulator [Bosea sp. (in: a-proteobacteria)]